MKYRNQISAGLVILSSLLLLLPGTGRYRLILQPAKLIDTSSNSDNYISTDRVARALVQEDSTFVLVDVRSNEEYNAFTIPGAINLPYESFFSSDPGSLLFEDDISYIFFSNDERSAMAAFLMAQGLGYSGVKVMEGGLNEWYRTIMLSAFTGKNLTPRENAIYETRLRARRLFNEINSLPDSLKIAYMESKRRAARELDGGCE